jgi:hypothetical protein
MSAHERTDLLRYATSIVRGKKMRIKNKKNLKKVNLLELSDAEKIKIIRAVKENLRQKAVEAKLWQSFVETDNITINGEKIHCNQMSLKGIYLGERFKSF